MRVELVPPKPKALRRIRSEGREGVEKGMLGVVGMGRWEIWGRGE